MSNRKHTNSKYELLRSLTYIGAIYYRLFHDYLLTGPGKDWRKDRCDFRLFMGNFDLPSVTPKMVKTYAEKIWPNGIRKIERQ